MRLSAVAIALLLALPAHADGPFATLDFDAAVAAAREQGKLLIVDFTARWCGPCQQMQKQTWPDETLGLWLAAHAVAIQVDVDQGQELAKRFDVSAIPTVVVLRDGEELDRKTGFQSPSELIQWAEPLGADRRSAEERAADDIKQLATSDNPRQVLHLGQDLARLQHVDDAAKAYLRASELSRDPARKEDMSSWRSNDLIPSMGELVERHPEALPSFANLVAATQLRVDSADPPAFHDWCEWLALCKAFNRTGDILRWYEAKRDEQGRLFGGGDLGDVHDDYDTLMRAPVLSKPTRGLDAMRDEVVVLLGEAGRASEALALLEDPVARAREKLEEPGFEEFFGALTPADQRGDLVKSLLDTRYYGLAQIWVLAVQAHRPELADAIVAVALDHDKTGTGRVMLVQVAWSHGLVDSAPCTRWLDEAAKLGAPDKGLRELIAPDPEPTSSGPPIGG